MALEDVMSYIAQRTREHDDEIHRMNVELFKHACEFSTYEELYCFVKRHCKSVEDFNISMAYCRPIFLDKD